MQEFIPNIDRMIAENEELSEEFDYRYIDGKVHFYDKAFNGELIPVAEFDCIPEAEAYMKGLLQGHKWWFYGG